MASSASAATFSFPANQTLDSNADGWTSIQAECTPAIQLGLCEATNTFQPELGAPQGSLETRFRTLVGALTDVEASASSIWATTFTWNGGTPTAANFSYDRRSELLQLLNLGSAQALVTLTDLNVGSQLVVVGPDNPLMTPVPSAESTFEHVSVNVSPGFIVEGHQYRIELRTFFQGTLTLLGGQRVNYDNVSLNIEGTNGGGGGDRNLRQVLPGAGGLGACTTDDSQVKPPPRGAGNPAGVKLEAAQLLINQRISQAGVRRANAVIDRITAGLTGDDIRDCALTEQDFNGSFITALKGPDPVGASTGAGAARAVPKRTRKPRNPAGVQLSRIQLLINQRISQAMVRRVNAVRQRLDHLTAGDFRTGSLDATALATDMRRLLGGGAPTSTAGSTAFAPITPAAPGARNPGAVTLSRGQLLINQRISQAGVRRINQIQAELKAGITGRMITDGSLVRASLTPAVQTGS